jgi:HEAT repeat protein
MTRPGILTTDADLIVRSWDAVLAQMTGISADAACGRTLAALAPEAEANGVLVLLREAIASGAAMVLAPAIHHYLFACEPSNASSGFTRMQQRVVVTPLRNEAGIAGLALSVEDVTERLDAERQLAHALRDPDPAVRKAAIERFGPLLAEGPASVQAVMRDEDWQVRRAAVGALAANPNRELLDAVIAALRDGHHDFSLLSSAIGLLEATGMNAADALIELLRSDDADVRIQAALALGLQSGTDVVQALVAALEDPDRNVRFHAIESLGRLGAADAVAPLSAMAAEADFFLAYPAIEALVKINDPSAAPRIVSRLDDADLRDAAADALGVLGDEDTVGPLVGHLEHAGAPVGSIVGALASIHARYEETSGAGGRIEDLTRRLLTPRGTQAVLDFVPVASGVELRSALLVLSWTGTASVAEALARLLGEAAVPHDVVETLVRFGSPILGVLIGQLQRGSIDTRRAAAVALGRLGDRTAVPALITMLEEGETSLLPVIATALARLGDQRAFEPLIGLLGHGDPAVRQSVVGALNSIGHPEMGARTAILLRDPDPHVRQSAAKIAGYFGYSECAEALIACGTDQDERVRAAALEHMPFLEDEAVLPLLVSALASDTPRCRAAAASALGHVEASDADRALAKALNDPDAWVRYFAALSLGRRRQADAIGALGELASADPAGQVRIAAIDALAAIGGTDALAILEPLADSAERDVAAAALRALGTVPAPGGRDTLQAALRSDDPERRVAAVQALAQHGGRDAVDALCWTAAADQDSGVAASAIDGLATLASRPGDALDAAVLALTTIATDPARRAAALPALARIPASAVPALDRALRHEDTAVRLAAIEALGRIARPPASTLLMQALDDPDASVRARAVDALSRLGARGVARRLASLARTDHSDEVRRMAEMALARAGDADAERRP